MIRELQLSALVFLGAGLGGVFRHLVNRSVPLAVSLQFPAATMLVNAIGCLAMGLIAGWFALRGEGGGQGARLFLTTGLLGGFTTFSAFSLDAATLIERGALGQAGLYVAGTLVLTLAGVFAGLAASRALFA